MSVLSRAALQAYIVTISAVSEWLECRGVRLLIVPIEIRNVLIGLGDWAGEFGTLNKSTR